MSNDISNTATHTSDTPQLLLEHHLKELRLPTMLREYRSLARPPHPPRPHPRDERRQLPTQAKPP
jgi:hypothetical protein